jgi:hypothetical protein
MDTTQMIMKPETIPQQETTRTSHEIESQICQMRSRMDAMLDELSQRLTARTIFQSAADWWKAENQGGAAVRSAMNTVYQQAKEHPAPVLLIGGGLAWLISERLRDSGDGLLHEAEDALVRGKLVVVEGVEAGSEKLEMAYHKHPVATGVAVAALGSLAGFAIWRGVSVGHSKRSFFDEPAEKLKSCWKTLKS